MKWTCSLHVNELCHVGMSRVYTQMWNKLFSLLSSSCRTSRVYSTRIHPGLTLLVSVFFFFPSSYFSPSGKIQQVQNTTSFHNSGKMNLNSIGNCTVRGHTPFKYPPRNTMPKSPSTNSNPLRISCSDTSSSPTARAASSPLHVSFVSYIHTFIHQYIYICIYVIGARAAQSPLCMIFFDTRFNTRMTTISTTHKRWHATCKCTQSQLHIKPLRTTL